MARKKPVLSLVGACLAAAMGLVLAVADSPPAQASPDVAQFPTQGWSLGGKVRGGPGLNFRQTGSLGEFNRITILRATGVIMGEYEWFEIRYGGGRRGFQWGGILCLDYPYQGAYYCERRGAYVANPIGGQVATAPPQTTPPQFDPPPQRPDPVPGGPPEVGSVYYNGGEFSRNDNLGPNMWQENTPSGQVFTYQETDNSRGQIYLWDGNRQLWILLDLRNQRIMTAANQGDWRDLHPITNVFYPDPPSGG
jgi:hypothetical protein